MFQLRNTPRFGKRSNFAHVEANCDRCIYFYITDSHRGIRWGIWRRAISANYAKFFSARWPFVADPCVLSRE